MNIEPRRNVKERLPIHQNFIEPHNYQPLFKSPVSTRSRQQRPSKLPSFKMPSGQQVSIAVSPPVSPQWRTRNMSRAESRMLNVSPPQVLQSPKYVIQMSIFNENLLQKALQRKNNETGMIKQLVQTPQKMLHQQSLIREDLNKASFKFLFVLGKGGFGKVWRVELCKTRKQYAMKEMSKARILSKKSVHSVLNEKILLSKLRHSFIANIHFAFQDRDHLHLVMDLLTGGDLRYHIGVNRRFTEWQTKFVIACLLLSLEYLQNNNIIHRDIKPENVVFDKKGYPRLTDFGIARVLKPENSQETSGTPGYMAPEVMCRQNHGIGVDHFALGVMIHEFMLGKRPYVGRSRKEIKEMMLTKQVNIKRQDGWSSDSADICNQLLQRKQQHRLGFDGVQSIKKHSWFQHVNWQSLIDKTMPSPFSELAYSEDKDFKRQISSDHDSEDSLIQENAGALRRNSIQDMFKDYEYNDRGVTGSTNSTQIQ
ncbi:unnamed protein product (macronuclear) [Paramecium tetraurelia]|uniref:Protein kinase domain-containing protein n=1 Tax=Paramecium tetraurelia TaxID=5888 RepID=A0BZE4_PARTE|nr:uncharacterized protein GSPATT00033764001 [Paramecium tetraurelia]CAK63911.1 unnamed protein product [Paramecium tetraurelia]|eukprot:XP_001431309.1 hypothetical protein (macronuclear) [Paramecium tetraurelia strain d4-2]